MLSFSKAAVEQEPYPSLKCEGRKKIRLSQTFVGISRGTRTEGSTLLLLLHLVRLLVKRFELKVSSISFGPFSVGERVALVVWGETTTVSSGAGGCPLWAAKCGSAPYKKAVAEKMKNTLLNDRQNLFLGESNRVGPIC